MEIKKLNNLTYVLLFDTHVQAKSYLVIYTKRPINGVKAQIAINVIYFTVAQIMKN